MTKLNNKRKGLKRNPMQSERRRIPRPISRFDGHLLCGTLTVPANVTGSNKGLDYHLVDTQSNIGISRTHLNITDSYQQYVYKKLVLEWLPGVGPGQTDAQSQIAMAFIDNPEDIFWVTQTATSSTISPGVLSTRKAFVFNAWERVTWNVPLRRRRKVFSVNTNMAQTVAEYERCTQGVVAVAITGTATAAVVLGSYRFYYEIELTGLMSAPGT